MSRQSLLCGASALALAIAMVSNSTLPARAQAQAPATQTLPDVDVTATKGARPGSEAEALETPPVVEKFQLPQTSSSVTAAKIEEQVNLVDTQDAVKYLPSLFVRKRNNGDTQPVLATRTWGVNSSARSLVYADDLLLTALVANNNTIGAPRWGLVAPEEIKRIDVLYGPFAAAYPGNSMGAVMQITTQMPDKPVATIKQTEVFQTFNQFGTKGTYRTDQTSALIGNRIGDLSWQLSGNYANSFSQPISFITVSSSQTSALATSGPSGSAVTGYWNALNKSGTVANVVGAGGLLHTQMVNLKAKVAYDFTSWLTGTYTLGYWSNDGQSKATSYLRTSTGAPTFGLLTGSNAISSFATNNYSVKAQHLTNAVALKTDTKGAFDWEVSANRYDLLQDRQISPFGITSGSDAYTNLGKSAKYDGTNWMNGDIKGIWRPSVLGGAHEFSFGLHSDRYQLRNPTYQLAQWNNGETSSNIFYTNARGQTLTNALWLQDAWKFAQGFKLTMGARFETWKASDGYSYTTTQSSAGVISAPIAVNQPELSATKFSPKASLSYDINNDWQAIGSFGKASRFPTVGELYQLAKDSNNNTYNPNPNLRPEGVYSSELAVERKLDEGKVRVSVFHERVDDALISQTAYIGGSPTLNATFVDNVARIRNQGVEVAAQKDNVLIDGLQVSGSVTYVNSRIVSDPTWKGSIAVVGKHVPYVPSWRATAAATYRPDQHWAFTVAGRYSGKMYSTLDNTDIVSNVPGSFDMFVVADTRVQYKIDERSTVSFGVDNIFNRHYTLFHPFPGRTYLVDAKFKF
jgi:iron complex outermembrane receptor protein